MSEYQRRPNTNCLICKKGIYRRPAEIRLNNGRVFCGQTCYGISQRKETPCIVCGNLILAGANKKTCNRACSNKNRAGMSYRGRERKDKVAYQRGLKIRLINQRGPACERCSYNKIEVLQVHHRDRDRKNNALKNLALICPNCHAEEHYLEKSWLNGKVLR